MWVGAVLASSHVPLDLAAVLLVMLAAVVALALVTGPVLAVLASLAVVVIVNWYLVPPYDTFQVASTENLVALVVFPLVAALTAGLVELAARARGRDAASASHAMLMGDVASTPAGSLDRVRRALDLEELRLVNVDGEVVARSGEAGAAGTVLDVTGPDGYRLIGTGVPRIAEDRDFIASIAAAAVRAHESALLEREKGRAQELAAVDEARSALLASVGHDLRTPLAGLRLAIDTLRSPDVDLGPEARAELLDTVDASTARLDELITNLLDMSRLEAGGLPVRREPLGARTAWCRRPWPVARRGPCSCRSTTISLWSPRTRCCSSARSRTSCRTRCGTAGPESDDPSRYVRRHVPRRWSWMSSTTARVWLHAPAPDRPWQPHDARTAARGSASRSCGGSAP